MPASTENPDRAIPSRPAADALPAELLVDAKPAPGDSSSGSGTAMLPFILPVFAGGALARFVSPTAGLLAFGASVAVLLLLRKPSAGRFILRVDGDRLEISRERASRAEATVRIALGEIGRVSLQRQAAPAGRGGATTERVRIALEREALNDDGSPTSILLPDDALTPLEGQEWQAKIRVFLRKHGWLPLDER